MKVLIVSPSLSTDNNVSGISAVTNFIIRNNTKVEYVHFLQGKNDDEHSSLARIMRLIRNYKKWKSSLNFNADAIIHYNFPLDGFSVIRDYFFMNYVRKSHKQMVIHIHGGLYLFKEKKPIHISILLKMIFSWNFPFIVLSNKECEQIKKVYHCKNVYVLPNCIDLRTASTFQRSKFPSRLHILYLGRIESNKGIDYIYHAIKILNNQGFDFVLHFAGKEQGTSGYIERFKQSFKEKFIYEGVVDGKAKEKLLMECQVFLLPSLYEGLPMSLLESMSFGVIPVTTNVGSIGDFVIDGETGLFINIKDSESIVNSLIKLSNSLELRAKLSKGAKEKVFNSLDPQEYICKLNSVYQQC